MENLAERLVREISQSRKRIVVIGDAITDRWVYGHVEPSQDGCQKFVQEHAYITPGGAANAHNCLTHWKVNADLFALAEVDRPVKTRFLTADGKITFRWDDETMRVQPGKWMYDAALEMVGCASGVLLSDYDKGFLSLEFIRQVADLCNMRGISCVADCKRGPEAYRGCIMKGNRDYCRKYGGLAVCTYGEGVPEVDGEFVHLNLSPVNCVNHVGAGDCFAAHLVLALSFGFPLKEAATLAHSAGRIYAQHPRNRAPYPAEVAADLSTSTST